MSHFKILGLAALAVAMWQPAAAETVAPTTGAGIVQLSELQGIENITHLANEAVHANKNTKGNPITIEGTVYESGVGTHAPSVCVVKLNGATSFHSVLGVDDGADTSAKHGIVGYTVTAYGSALTENTQICTGVVNRQEAIRHYDLDIADLTPYKYLKLEYTTNGDAWADHADWADARFTYTGAVPEIIAEQDMFIDPENVVELPAEPSLAGAQIIPLSTLDLTQITNGWGTIRANRSIDNNAIMMKGKRYTSGVGIHANAKVVVKLNGTTPKFHAEIGIDDEVAANCKGNQKSNVDYKVVLRGQSGEETVAKSGTINYNDPETVVIDLDNLTAYKYLILDFDKAGQDESDHVDLGNAYFEFLYQNSNTPELVHESALLGTLDAATTLFSQPGVRFMHKLRASSPEATVAVENLPAGLEYNATRNLVEGIIDVEGTYDYTVKVTLDGEETISPVTLTVSSNLQQPTPFMGWLSWNSVERNISGDVIKAVADQMESKGLIDAGYKYLVIDDLWHADSRAADGTPVEHPTKFPLGMKASADYVHGKGMKFGIYSDAAARTCAGAYGSYGYETKDANQYAAWGVDLLKYDYCGAPGDLEAAKTRYKAMGDALKASGRDIILYVCEWGVREPWKWGAEAGGTCWRASYDTRDCWHGKPGGIGVIESIAVMKDIWQYNGVNRWNDADMMMVGINGTGKSSSDLCATGPGMTKDEYRTQFALWCMWASPLTLSNDMSQPLSEEDHAIMTNAELIALNQDRMGQAGETIFHDANDYLLLAKDCENGDVAISLTNLTDADKAYSIDFNRIPALDPSAEYFCRDVVKHADLPKVSGSVDLGTVPTHATVVYRLSLKNPESSINEVATAEALDKMTVTTHGDTVNVCLTGSANAEKRILLSDVEGRVLANATGSDECFSLRVPARGIYVVNVTCAGRSITKKVTL